MAHSQNGWPVVSSDQVVDRAIFGVEFPNGWLKGDVDTIFTYLVTRLHREVEPMITPGCWGWFVKVIEGTSIVSNHASATAFDYNAPKHPMGVSGTWSDSKRSKIHGILNGLDGVVRWGDDYTYRKDGMHFEIDKDASAVRTVANRIRATGRVVQTVEFNVVYPLLQEGDDDNLREGYDIIRRIQRQIFNNPVDWDGVWGRRTTEALGANKMTEDLYRRLFGGSRA